MANTKPAEVDLRPILKVIPVAHQPLAQTMLRMMFRMEDGYVAWRLREVDRTYSILGDFVVESCSLATKLLAERAPVQEVSAQMVELAHTVARTRGSFEDERMLVAELARRTWANTTDAEYLLAIAAGKIGKLFDDEMLDALGAHS